MTAEEKNGFGKPALKKTGRNTDEDLEAEMARKVGEKFASDDIKGLGKRDKTKLDDYDRLNLSQSTEDEKDGSTVSKTASDMAAQELEDVDGAARRLRKAETAKSELTESVLESVSLKVASTAKRSAEDETLLEVNLRAAQVTKSVPIADGKQTMQLKATSVSVKEVDKDAKAYEELKATTKTPSDVGKGTKTSEAGVPQLLESKRPPPPAKDEARQILESDKLLDSVEQGPAESATLPHPGTVSPVPEQEKYVILADHMPQTAEEIHVVEGELVARKDTASTDWIQVKKRSSTEQGFVPAVFLETEGAYRDMLLQQLADLAPNLPATQTTGGKQREPAKIIEQLRESTAIEGSTVEMSLKIVGQPPPDVYWLRHTTFIRPDENNFKAAQSSDGICKLTISDVIGEDAGIISVIVKNEHGFDVSSAPLNVIKSKL